MAIGGKKMSDYKLLPSLRPLAIWIGVMVVYCVRLEMKAQEVTLQVFAMVGGFFLFGAALTILVQIVRKKEFGWTMSFVGTLGFGVLLAIVMLSLKKLGLIYQ